MSESYFVPGRVNLIGEHTDYNEGLALPFALHLGVTIDVATRNDQQTWIEFEGGSRARIDVCDSTEQSLQMASAVFRRSPRRGIDLRVSSTLPTGAGLSSSAAYIGALALALGVRGTLLTMARFVQACEADVGSDVGLLDQIATLGATAQAASLIDFSELTVSHHPLPPSWRFTVVHSEVQRQLAHSGYADRRSECRAIYELVGSWSDLNLTSLNRLPSPLQQRARHIVTENQRVRHFVAAMAADHIITAGQILTESHASLRDDFEVSLPAVDALIDTIAVVPGVRGARLIGGGFGGCVLVLHEPNTEVAIPGHRSWSVEPSEGALGRITTN